MVTDLPWDDRTDFEDADRGRIDGLDPCVIRNSDGAVVWNNDAFAFLNGECPDTANPSLWRQSQLCAKQGLYEVTDGIYQVRGLDLSNMTLVESDNGVIVIDPLIFTETAAAGLALYRRNRGDRPVTAVIYTHSHIDHFGGVEGVVTEPVPILAPVGFLEHAVAENVYAGTAMLRRGNYHAGQSLEPGPRGLIGTGLGQTGSYGTVTLLPPTIDITHTGQQEILDGVRIVFQSTPDTEAPSEMNFSFPDHRALCLAENATHNLHNILTLRGAVVRDARMWSRYLHEAIDRFTANTDVAFASHHWPTWGRDRIRTFLGQQRDLYAYLHDQTLRLLNQGLTGTEIAEAMTLPPALEKAWHTRGYYGSVFHNVKAIYQRYLGWFDGNPAHLWELPPVEAATRYVECMGGPDAVLRKAREYASQGDLRFAAELLNHAVFADPSSIPARTALAEVYEQLGFGAENGTWRNFYLTGAQELRHGVSASAQAISPTGMVRALTIEQIFDSLAIRVNGPKAWSVALSIDWDFVDEKTTYRTMLSNGVLVHWPDPGPGDVDLTVTLNRQQLLGLLTGQGLVGVQTAGDPGAFQRLIGLLEQPDPGFAIVTP
ncbi:MAG: MBL fold metallo-hydrolase [Mycobacterium sp.]|nr:MBL fold metallo-hydrolase [Mycobacterium sp.]